MNTLPPEKSTTEPADLEANNGEKQHRMKARVYMWGTGYLLLPTFHLVDDGFFLGISDIIIVLQASEIRRERRGTARIYHHVTQTYSVTPTYYW